MKKIFVLLLTISLVYSCKEEVSQARTDYEEILQEILDGHDDLMKELSTIDGLIVRLEPRIDTTDKGIDYGGAVKKLKDAHDFMFSWMRDFSKEFPDIADKNKKFSEEEYLERIRGLKKQKETLSRLEEAFEESITEAEALIID